MSLQSWFPTFIYDAPLQKKTSQKFLSALLEDSYKVRENDRNGQKWSRENYPNGFTSYSSMNRLHKTGSSFWELEKKLSPHLETFAKYLEWDLGKGRKLTMTDCWVNIMRQYAVHPLHLHPLSVISGTFYVKTPKACSSLRFEDPRLSKLMGAPPKKSLCRPENKQQVLYPVEAGKVILFESWLRHEVRSNPSQEERVSISFNYHWL